MHPSSLLSYYPTYAILDEIVALNEYDTLNLFIDLKNVLQAAYMEHAIVNIIESTKRSRFVDTSIFSSLISFISFHKMWSIKRGVDVNFFVFFEVGHSYYHKNIDKRYKISREVSDLFDLSIADRDIYYSTLQSNYNLIESASKKLPSIRTVKLKNMEADFIPYYTITRNLVKQDIKTANVIYSTDHDMWQTLDDHTFIYWRHYKKKTIIKQGKVMSRFLKQPINIPDEYLPLAMSIIGDRGDDVMGVQYVGPKTFIDIFDQLKQSIGTMDSAYDRIENGEELFDATRSSSWNKQMKRVVRAEWQEQIISKNLRLVSFELMSRTLDTPKTTEMLERRRYIEDVIQGEKKIASSEAMKTALEKNGVYLEEASIDFLYV
jgi:hypothetical protein